MTAPPADETIACVGAGPFPRRAPLLLLLLLVFPAAAATGVSGPPLKCSMKASATTFQWALLEDGSTSPLMSGDTTAVHLNGQWYYAGSSSPTHASSSGSSTHSRLSYTRTLERAGTDTIGEYNETLVEWSAGGTAWHTGCRSYSLADSGDGAVSFQVSPQCTCHSVAARVRRSARTSNCLPLHLMRTCAQIWS